ncbi:MAG TPA: DUF1638 domain-containing protein [Candidatus Paceibacterota bacterium]|nr:DUF1638 domain-containing protein [Verrucomicrobiota bacterium]HSA10211.1 DUF1638 domain-containing protein [Candidatus Paceibacterota bacterium]
MFYKVIACEIAFRELCHAAARSKNLIDFDFLTQGYHDIPGTGRTEIQKRIDAAPAGRYDAILLGYGLCSNILTGLTTAHTPLVIPRAHDCITFFLGSKERYRECFDSKPGTYYYTSGWLECARRRGQQGPIWGGASLPAGANTGIKAAYEEWVKKYGEDQASYLMEEMNRWTESYSHGILIDFDFVKHLRLCEQVQEICRERGWDYEEIQGDLGLFHKLLEGEWPEADFLIVRPGQKVIAANDERVIGVQSAGP